MTQTNRRVLHGVAIAGLAGLAVGAAACEPIGYSAYGGYYVDNPGYVAAYPYGGVGVGVYAGPGRYAYRSPYYGGYRRGYYGGYRGGYYGGYRGGYYGRPYGAYRGGAYYRGTIRR